jgi:hypothetical protein
MSIRQFTDAFPIGPNQKLTKELVYVGRANLYDQVEAAYDREMANHGVDLTKAVASVVRDTQGRLWFVSVLRLDADSLRVQLPEDLA